jgi:hypothetical protein
MGEILPLRQLNRDPLFFFKKSLYNPRLAR